MSDKDEATTQPTADDPQQPTEQSAETGLRDQLAAAIAERDEHRDKWLRSEAELENFRKRVRKETEELLKYGTLNVARDLLPGLDNLDRAIAAAESTGNVEDLLQGIRMVSQQFRDVFAKHGVEAIVAAGEPFDPNLHEALQQVPTDEHPPMTVLQELETGFQLHDRVIRPSKVIVAAAMPETEQKEVEG